MLARSAGASGSTLDDGARVDIIGADAPESPLTLEDTEGVWGGLGGETEPASTVFLRGALPALELYALVSVLAMGHAL